MSADDAFRAFEHAGWQGAARGYHDTFGALTAQAIEPLLDAVGARAGTRLLDVATGPGYVAAAAVRRGVRVTGVDFSASMLALARAQVPAAELREGDAEALPLEDGGFDAAVTNFGLLHFARPERALAEAHRVLRPGGRVAFTVWATPEEAIGFGILLRAVRAAGNPDAPLPPGPPFFRFSDTGECRRALAAAGFEAATVTQVPMVWRLRSPDDLVDAFERGTVRSAGLLRAQRAEALPAIRAAIVEEARRLESDEGVMLPMPAVLASATKK